MAVVRVKYNDPSAELKEQQAVWRSASRRKRVARQREWKVFARRSPDDRERLRQKKQDEFEKKVW
jgi:hypothetical protein